MVAKSASVIAADNALSHRRGDAVLARRRSGALAPANKQSLAVAGQALIKELIYDRETLAHLATAKKVHAMMQGPDGHGGWSLDHAKPFHFRHLPLAESADAAEGFLGRMLVPTAQERVTPDQASVMLTYLFSAKGRRRDEEAAAKLAACVDIFHPGNDLLADTLGLGLSEVPGHPAVLAFAIKSQMASNIHEPEEAELREALTKVHRSVDVLCGYVRQWLGRLKQADKLVFKLDRPAWQQAYARVNSAVVRVMLPSNEEGYVDKDDGDVVPPSERWQTLHDQLEAKEAAEKAALPPTPEERRKAAAMLTIAGIPAK